MVDGSRSSVGAGTGLHRRTVSRVRTDRPIRLAEGRGRARVAARSPRGTRDRADTVLLASGAGGLLVTTLAVLLGVSPLPQLVVCALLVLVALGQRLPWSLALSAREVSGNKTAESAKSVPKKPSQAERISSHTF